MNECDELRLNRDRAVRLLTLAMTQLRRWGDAYGTHTPLWLPPAGDVRLAEEVDEFTRQQLHKGGPRGAGKRSDG